MKKKKNEHNIIKDVRNLFSIKKEIDDRTVKDMRSIFRLKKENKTVKNTIIRFITNFFEYEED